MQMQNSIEVCRPPHLTTHWVEDITDAISRVCKDPNIRRATELHVVFRSFCLSGFSEK